MGTTLRATGAALAKGHHWGRGEAGHRACRLPGGKTVADRFVARRTALTEADRQMVLAWRDLVEGLFEMRGKEGECLRLLNLLDDLEYRTYTYAGRSTLRGVAKGGFLGARLVSLATRSCADASPGTTRASRAPESP